MLRRTTQRILAAAALLAAAAGFALPAAGQARNVSVSLISETALPTPGSTVRMALRFQPRPGWHVYWQNPGDSGMPPSVSWTFPSGFRAGDLRHPAPITMEAAGFVSFVHEGDVALLTDVTVPASAAMGQDIPVIASVRYLACSDSLCVPETATAQAWLTISENRSPRASNFSAFEQRLPRQLGHQGSVRRIGDDLEIRIRAAGGADGARLFPISDGFFKASAQQAVREEAGELVFTIKAARPGQLARFDGIVTTRRHPRGFQFAAAAMAAPASETPAIAVAQSSDPSGSRAAANVVPASPSAALPAAPPASPALPVVDTEMVSIHAAASQAASLSDGLLSAFLGALLGGLLLNLMPCVFPILSLKALTLARAGSSETTARRDGLAYAAGAILACTALGGALLTLRAAGSEVGWAFQLQNPLIILLLIGLVAAIGLNLLGIFALPSLPVSSSLVSKDGTAGSFWSGVLAAFIATPCSGPFMGVALGAALVLSAPAALAMFAGLGLGLALPFLALAFIPPMRRILPKPGPWMVRLRQILSIPMFLTAAALLWVLGRQAGNDGLAAGLWLIACFSLALLWLGRGQRLGKPAWLGFFVLANVSLLAFVHLDRVPLVVTRAFAATDSVRPFSEDLLNELRAQGRPVFVDFTADWCLTCKVNERMAINTDATRAAFAEAGVVTLIGDWTNGDPAITRFLAANGRNSIPFYLFYAPSKEMEVLPQILTPALLERRAQSIH